QEVEVVKNAFLHNMSFEIRTPLNTVVGFAELFQMEHTAEDETVFIKEIKENSAKLLKLINDILFLSRLDAEMITMRPSTVDFAAVFPSKVEAAWAHEKQAGVNYITENPFRKLLIEVDDMNISIIIEKIVLNAVQHTTNGQVRVRYDYVGDQLIVVVEDTGSGIPDETLNHIFERFITGEGNTDRAGLGLSICHDLIQQLGGSINIKSTVGKGTNVWFSIPCKLIEADRI
ncbi:MAG: HAMP domain-containing histidine kinase, partial [Prevotella sp.]|nr:HAMP domain-containing histidine kinase [Prevotella sp.]